MNHDKAATLVENKFGKEGVWLFLMLLNQKPEQVDATVYLQGDQLDRAQKVIDLYKAKCTPVVLITGNNNLIGRGKRNEEEDFHLNILKNELVKNNIPESAITVDNTSVNTLDQAKFVISWAKEKNYKKLLIVTSPFHVLRAYLTFLKQIKDQKWRGEIIMQKADLPWGKIPAGRKRTALDMLKIELEKIQKYSSDLTPINNSENL